MIKRLLGNTLTSTCRIEAEALSRLSNCIPGGWSGDVSTRPGDPVRSCGHWLFHLDVDVLNDDDKYDLAGPDGVPIVFEGYRRMWAGGKIDFLHPILVASNIKKTIRVMNVEKKSSKKYGDMIFVTRESTLTKEEENVTCVVDKTNHVYLKGNELYSPPSNPIIVDPRKFEWQRIVKADPVSLFRFSALTWNSHRIHYDLEHARNVEGYPDLVVHGPILSMLMLDLFQQNNMMMMTNPSFQYQYEYRGLQPMFVTSDINIVGRRDDDNGDKFSLYALNDMNEVCMQSNVVITRR